MMSGIFNYMTLGDALFWSCLASYFVGLLCGGALMLWALRDALDKRPHASDWADDVRRRLN